MRVKKYYSSFTIILDILLDDNKIEFEKELEEIFNSFDEITLLDRNIPHNDIIKLQQKNPKHVLLTTEIKPFDNIRLLLKFVHNFLIITNQSRKFSVETLMLQGEEEIIAYGTEIYQYPIQGITFSPIARAKWSNPQLINKIIDKG